MVCEKSEITSVEEGHDVEHVTEMLRSFSAIMKLAREFGEFVSRKSNALLSLSASRLSRHGVPDDVFPRQAVENNVLLSLSTTRTGYMVRSVRWIPTNKVGQAWKESNAATPT